MCGITGFVKTNKADFDLTNTIQNMTNSLTHRGPDESGSVVLAINNDRNDNFIAFGHTRLKIIDLSEKARQPMSNISKSVYLTYNGEIYNYIELRDQLRNKGHIFFSTSDTEVILKAYEEWGTDCFNKFNGMWALAIFDKDKEKVILSRDRFGKKPLYYFKTENDFIFSSEIKALFKHPIVKKEPNFEKAFRYIAYNYRYVDIDDDSYFKNIFQVPKSCYFEIDTLLKTKKKRYWSINPHFVRNDISDKDAIETFTNLLIDAVRIRLRSDVPVGCMLSGGLDSTSITSIAYKVLKKPIVAFSGITGEEKGIYDESEYIDSVVRETNANFHYIRTDPTDIFKTIDQMLYFHDEPICTVTWYSLFLIAKKIGLEKVPVVLNGLAGDELLGGYWDHYHYNFFELHKSNDESLEYEINCWKKNHKRNINEVGKNHKYIEDLLNDKTNEINRFPDYSFLFENDVIKTYKRYPLLENNFDTLLNKRLYSELVYETIPACLRPEDRNTMGHSIESRSPFLDYRLVELCFSLPNRFKIRDGLGKWILRKSMKGILPENVRTRMDKAGFIAPADQWFRTINKKQIFNLINSEPFKSRNLFKITRTNEMFKEHLSNKRNHQMVLWQIINLELWFRRFFDE